MRQPLREDGPRLAAEVLDGPVELTGQSLRRILARPLDLVGELLLEGVGEAARGSLDDPLQLVHLAPFDLGQPRLDPLGRIRLLGADALPQLALALPQPLCDLVQRAAPVALELPREGLLRAFEISAPFAEEADATQRIQAGLAEVERRQ